MSIAIGLLSGLIGGAVLALFLALRYNFKNVGAACGSGFVLAFLLLFIENGAVHTRPTMTSWGILPLILGNLVTLFVLAAVIDVCAMSLSAATPLFLIGALIAVGVYAGGINSGHGLTVPCPNAKAGVGYNGKDCLRAAYGLVPIEENPSGTLPASVTTNLVVVTPDIARNKASIAMSSGQAANQNYSSYLNLGPATLEMVGGVMMYAFPLDFDGSINKARLHAISPGYILVNAQDPTPPAIEHYNTDPATGVNYSMTIGLEAGQGAEPDRWARSHGYEQYLLDDPTFEVADNGAPYFTVTLMSPQVGETFQAPVGILLIDAHTGAITRYSLPGRGLASPAPSWVDRIYSASEAMNIANSYGFYGHAGFSGQGNANRYQVSSQPVMVYTGDGNPSWRMLLTSYGNEQSTYRIIEMDAASGAIQTYTPAEPMGIESSVITAFCTPTGTGAANVKSNKLLPEDLTLHVIDGTLVWMANYEPSGGSGDVSTGSGDVSEPCGSGNGTAADKPTFSGIGFVPAYAVQGSYVVYGATRADALQNLAQELAAIPSSQGTANAGSTTTVVTGKLCAKDTDLSGGTSTYYLTMCGPDGKPDTTVVYYGTSTSAGTAIILAKPGDTISMHVSKFTAKSTSQQISSFSDEQHQVSASTSAFVTGHRAGLELAA